MYDQAANPGTYATFGGLVLFAVLVTVGLRSITAAIIAGLSFTVVPGLFATYLPTSWGELPTLLFGLGAIGVATNPDGVLASYARQLQSLVFGRGRSRQQPAPNEVTKTGQNLTNQHVASRIGPPPAADLSPALSNDGQAQR
jgi:branched-chain amino acid transport system permease protein